MEAANSKMDDDEEIAFNRLEICNYRHLQSLAKQMGLPSNVKKVELIEMIRAKRYCSESDLERIVNRVKMERKVNAKLKRNNQKKKTLRLQGIEVSSTSQSPPITLTPVCPSEYVIEYSSESPLEIMKPNPRPSVVQAGAPFLQKLKSDRVLRSYNSMKRPNYRILDQTDCVVGVVKSRNTVKEIRHRERIQQIQEIREDRTFRSVVTVQKQHPAGNAVMLRRDRQLVPVIPRTINTGPNQTKRQRKVSGIYPLECQENPQYEYMPTVNFRQTDGRICKINAVIQRPLANTLLPKNHTFLQKKSLIRRDSTAYVNPIPRVTVQDVINYEVDHPTVDLTGPRVIEPNKVHEIDHSNGIDWPSYEHSNVNNQQIEPMSKSRHIEQPIQDNQSNSSRRYDQNNASAVKLSYQGRTLVNIVPENTERDQNRKVYKNHQSDARKGWSTGIDQTPKVKRAKSRRSLTELFLNTTDASTSTCFTHKHREFNNQVPDSTSNEVVPKIISAPMSREPRFDQEIRDRNMEHARNMEYARNAEHARNVVHSKDTDYTRNAEHNMNMEDYVYSRHVDYARNSDASCTELARIDHARNTDIETHKTETDLGNQYPNMSSLIDVLPNEDYTQHTDTQTQYSVYYHKKVKADQIRCNKFEKLPRINEVFSQFNDEAYKKSMQPLYVKVIEESDTAAIPMTLNVNNACLLETIYNFKSQFLTNPPLRRVAPSKSFKTNCTYTTKTVPTAIEQCPAAGYNEHCNPYKRHSTYQPYTEAWSCNGQLALADVRCDEEMNSPTVTIDTQASQDLDNIDAATIPSPEMVDDALELISQDGDYMERIGMDVRVQCILCAEWAGPKFILEYHIKKEHHHDIHHISSPTCRVQLSLSRSLGAYWSSQLLQYRDTLYALSAQRNETSLMLAFSAIPNDLEIPRRCRITVRNKSYECDIQHIPDSMPYEYGQECLTLNLDSLDLLASLGKVGQSKLDSIELAVYIQLFD